MKALNQLLKTEIIYKEVFYNYPALLSLINDLKKL
jgi:hypothetical protein